MNARLVIYLAAFVVAASASAVTTLNSSFTLSDTGKTRVLTVSYQQEADGIHIAATISESPSGWDNNWTGWYDGAVFASNSISFVWTNTSSSVRIGWRNGAAGAVWGDAYGGPSIYVGPHVPGAVAYKITFKIPAVPRASDGGLPVHYQIRNATGDVLGEYTAQPGDPESEVLLAGLDHDDGLTLVRLEGHLESTTVDGITSVTFVSTGATTISSGTPLPGAGATVSAPSTPVPTPPSTPTPTPSTPTPTDTPAAPTPTTPVTVPSLPTLPTPTGTDGAKKEDVMASANQITTAVHDASAKAVEVGNKVIEATDKVAAAVHDGAAAGVTATDKVAAAVSDTGGKLVVAANKAQTSYDEMNRLLKVIAEKQSGGTDMTPTNAKLDTANAKLEDVKGNTAATVSKLTSTNEKLDQLITEQKKLSSPDSFNSSTAMTSANSAAEGSTYGGKTVTGNSVTVNTSGTSDGLLPTASVHVGDRDITIGSVASFGTALGFLRSSRALVLVALVIWFFRSCSDTIERYVIGLGHIGGGGSQAVIGVEVAAPGVAQAKHLASATAIAAVGLGAVATIIALVDTIATRYGFGVSAMLTAFTFPELGGAVAWVDQYFPVATATALIILRAAVGYMVAPIYIAAATLARFLHV